MAMKPLRCQNNAWRSWEIQITSRCRRGLHRLAAVLPALLLPVAWAADSVPSAASVASLRGNFQAPARVAVNALSQLCVSDPIAQQVFVLDAFGRELSARTFPGRPLGLAVGADGKVYLGDASSGAVSVLDAQWNLLGQLGQGAGEFQLPGHIALLTNGAITTVLVSDGHAHTLKAYRNGSLVGQYGGRGVGPQQFDFPAGLWVAPDRTVFVVDQNNDRIQVLDEGGNFLRWFGLNPSPVPFGTAGRAQGIVGDGHGRLFIADTFLGHVKIFSNSGAFLGAIARPGSGPGQLQSPGGLALDAAGRLWVASANGASVEGFGLDCFLHVALTPLAQTVAAGAGVSLAVTSGCGGPAGIQWFKNGIALLDGATVNGATNATLSLLNVTSTETGLYSVAVTNAGGTWFSPPAQLTVVSLPVITSHPVSRSVVRASAVSFSVSAQGGALSYQWLRNGAELAGATQSLLSITNVQSYEAGSYSVRVSNAAGTLSSAAATLTVLVPPTITEAPADQIAAAGSTVALTASAVGAPPLTYQWYRNNLSISGQTRSQLVLTNVTSAANGTYIVRVANSAGAATASFRFAVNSPMVLTNARVANGSLVLTWNNPFFVLQSAPDWSGPWQLLSPTSPYTVTAVMMTNSAQYFRLERQ